ncbi:hypothetical protein SH139x_000326 [Planctomycetaceae bacterium SH139]
MFLLHCPKGHELPVTASAAGSQVTCPTCGEEQAVPKLGELRKLPTANPEPTAGRTQGTTSDAARLVFALFMFGAVGAGASAAFAAFRWQSFPVPPTSEQHIASDRKDIAALNPLELLNVWESYEKMDLTSQIPFPYQRMQNLRDHWQNVCLISSSIAGACLLAASGAVIFGRRKSATGHLG